jgi:uncharacterized protein YjbI with pentapeptide repeats
MVRRVRGGSQRLRWLPTRRQVMLPVAGATLAVVAIFMLLVVPDWLVGFRDLDQNLEPVDRVNAVIEERRTVLAFLGALGVAAGLYYTHLRHELDRDSNRTERYTRAVEQLGHASPDIQLGGIYALERIAHDSKRDRGVINEVLSAFIREHTRAPVRTRSDVEQETADVVQEGEGKAPSTVVSAGLAVLARRPKNDRSYPPADLRGVDLSYVELLPGASLRGAHLAGATLTGVDFGEVDLCGAKLIQADLRDARLIGADLAGAYLTAAYVERGFLTAANLRNANLTGAYLTRANLEGVDLTGTDLSGADLREANLSQALLDDANLSGAHLSGARLDHADLSGAILRGADLNGVDLRQTILDDTDFDEVGTSGSHVGWTDSDAAPDATIGGRADEPPPVQDEHPA